MDRPVATPTLVEYDFFACHKCSRLIMKPELEATLGPGGSGQPCGCGGSSVTPANPRWFQWLLPRVLRFVWQRFKAGRLGWRQVRLSCNGTQCSREWLHVYRAKDIGDGWVMCPSCGIPVAIQPADVAYADVPVGAV